MGLDLVDFITRPIICILMNDRILQGTLHEHQPYKYKNMFTERLQNLKNFKGPMSIIF
jgi:hypothetical protein